MNHIGNLRIFRRWVVVILTCLCPVLPEEPLPEQPTLDMVAVAHLDTQWRWTVRDSIDRFLRNTLDHNFERFEQYPEYRFNFEGAFRYELMKTYYPERYERMKEYVRAGRWHVSGAAMDAVDVVLPAPESVIRNMLYAQHFYRREFGWTTDDAYLPDCFGFPMTFPTLARHCDVSGFSTQKLGWGSAVGIPFHVGVWEGMDGSRLPSVLHAGPYNWTLRKDVSKNKGLLHMIRQQEASTTFPIGYRYFGVGDQGGAPDESTVAWIARAASGDDSDLNVRFADSDRIFHAMRPEHLQRLPLYKGDLLMTDHGVGAYTTYGVTKWWSRRLERLAAAAERSALIAWLDTGIPMPHQELTRAWKRFLWHHQHDGITGTSIPDANDIMINDQVISHNQFEEILRDSVRRRVASLDTRGSGQPVILVNPSPFARRDVVEVAWPLPTIAGGVEVLHKGQPVPI